MCNKPKNHLSPQIIEDTKDHNICCRDFSSLLQGPVKGPYTNEKYSKFMQNSQNCHS